MRLAVRFVIDEDARASKPRAEASYAEL